MKLFDVYPLNNITITRADGSNVWDDQENQYLDMYGGHAVISIGHTHPHWVQRIEDQLKQIAFYSNSVIIPLQQQLAEKLGKLSGKTDYELFLCNSGAEANENALKLASFHTGRKKIIAFKKSFHGRTSLAVAATDNPAIVAPVNETDNIVFLPFNDTASLREYFEQHGETIAAVITEGIQGVGGINVAADDFLQTIRQLCNQYGAVFIADSVQCGYGRTGKFFAHDHAGVDADIYSMAKGMGNGFPIGGILIAPHIRPKHGMLGTTFGGNHLACAAALAVLEIMEQEDLMQKAAVNGAYMMEQLKTIPEIQNVRGRGWMIGFDVPDTIKELKKVLLSEYKTFTGEAKPNVIRLLPSLALDKNQANDFLYRLREAIQFIQTANPSS
ncbi:MAG: aspartate aminotransferase family protein [Sediminibacterium sp. Gen4]|jgi:acetylornithine/N-succinyldiaminopimelate aminotransferase|uniref:aspartate aminotransferase family protein n=1 Tax=unclassified Sediminibacterium TaxID=2635961 RepID=UPI0015B9B52F|nr:MULTISPECIES: aminotransferase class III-fold pyridoxal phosphate-dependent enzyme [unclassified Sediminibacterium]MBW0160867.1 aminotransferase class III-fold pyridoxal phosphate-dependent enzyme [Sediminibacterium sp.]MBW0163001.1 aminotransferase class III-fold pyridoxal phosphate-dependent enzyme [Sediminibacterium sp.]NWK66748.1 aspartate aminotransferase family protein [Sediminibacterium sp. Gen4]